MEIWFIFFWFFNSVTEGSTKWQGFVEKNKIQALLGKFQGKYQIVKL